MDNLDYFAGQALTGILASRDNKHCVSDEEYNVGLLAYGYAYGMLRARETLAPSKKETLETEIKTKP